MASDFLKNLAAEQRKNRDQKYRQSVSNSSTQQSESQSGGPSSFLRDLASEQRNVRQAREQELRRAALGRMMDQLNNEVMPTAKRAMTQERVFNTSMKRAAEEARTRQMLEGLNKAREQDTNNRLIGQMFDPSMRNRYSMPVNELRNAAANDTRSKILEVPRNRAKAAYDAYKIQTDNNMAELERDPDAFHEAQANLRRLRDEYEKADHDLKIAQGYHDMGISDLPAAFKQGYYNSAAGEEWFKEAWGEQNEREKYDEILSQDEYKFLPNGRIEKAISGAAGLLGQQAYQFNNDKTKLGVATLTPAVALAAAPGGPAAMAAGAMTGLTTALAAGSAAVNFSVEAGGAYKEMIENGINPDTAKLIATAVGGTNAALEYVQASDLLKAFAAIPSTAANTGIKQIIAQELIDRGVDVADNVAQEVLQEGVTIGGAQAASRLQRGEWQYPASEVIDRLLETAGSSALSFAAAGLGTGAKNVTLANMANNYSGADFNADDGGLRELVGLDAARAAGNGDNNSFVDNINPGVDATGNIPPSTEDQLAALARQTYDTKEAQRQALYDAGKNHEQNIRPLMDSATMLTEDEKLAAVRQGNQDATDAEIKEAMSAPGSAVQPISDADLNEYIKAGTKKNVHKRNAVAAGKDIILRTATEAKKYISNAIHGNGLETVAFGKVGQRLVDDANKYTGGKIDLKGMFLELIPNNIKHAYQQHLTAKYDNNIDLTEQDFLNIPRYIAEYDDFIEAVEYKNDKEIKLGKRLDNGGVVIIQAVSNNRGALQFKNMWGLTNEGYEEYIKNRSSQVSQEAFLSASSTGYDGASSINIIPSEVQTVKENINGGQAGEDLSGEGSLRNVSFGSGESVSGVQAQARRVGEIGQAFDFRDSEAGTLRVAESVKAERVIRSAVPGQTVYHIEGDTEETSAAKAMASAAGYDADLFATENGIVTVTENGEEADARGFFDPLTGKIGALVNNPDATARQIIGHEIVERAHGQGRINVHDIYNQIVQSDSLIGNVIDKLSEIYLDASTAQSIEDARKELFCDIGGGINQFENYDDDVAALMDRIIEQVRPMLNNALNGALDAKAEVTTSAVPKGNTEAAEVAETKGIQYSIEQFANSLGFEMQFGPEGQFKIVNPVTKKPITHITPNQVKNTAMGALIQAGVENKTISEDTAKAQRKMFADLMNLTLRYDPSSLPMVWEVAGSYLFSSVKTNSDAQYATTVDYGTICSKTQALIDVLSNTMVKKGRGLTREEVIEAYNRTAGVGLQVPCPVCYVFSRWMGVPSLLDNMRRCQERFGNASESYVQKYIAKMLGQYNDAKSINNRKTQVQNRMGALERQLQQANANNDLETKKLIRKETRDLQYELDDLESFNWVTQVRCISDGKGGYKLDPKYKSVPMEVLLDLRRSGDFAKNYPKSWKYRTTRGAGMGKAIMPYSGATIGDFIKGTKDAYTRSKNPFLNMNPKAARSAVLRARLRAAAQNLIGGQRFQSTSDYRAEWGIDYLMTFLECQAAGSQVQLYTKVIEAVDLFATAGAEVNCSIMPQDNGYITLANGKKKLIFSDVTGINFDEAYKKVRKYDNVQMILVGINDEHIRLAMADDRISFIIPWHSSGNSKDTLSQLMSAVGETLDVNENVDYSDSQTDKVIDNSPHMQRLRQFRKEILQGKLWENYGKRQAKTLTKEQADMLAENEYLNDLYNKFYQDESAQEYGVRLNGKQTSSIFPYEYWDKSLTVKDADQNGERFKEYCASLGIQPRFVEKFGNDPGYWKLLIDRKMYNNDGTYHVPKAIDVTNIKVDQMPMAVNSNNYKDMNKIDQATMDLLMALDRVKNDLSVEDNSGAEIETRLLTDVHSTKLNLDKVTEGKLDSLVKKYGALPRGENPTYDVDVPTQTSDGRRVRRYARTVLESGVTSDMMNEEIAQKILKEGLSYEPVTDKSAAEYAASVIRIGGTTKAQKEWNRAIRSDNFNKRDMAVGQELLREYAKQGDVDNVINMVTELAAQGTRMGQNIQAMRMLKKYATQSPAIGLGYIQETVNIMNHDAEEKMGKRYKPMVIDPQLADEYINATTRDQIDAALGKIYKNLGSQVQKTTGEEIADRLRTWRYMSMLGNPRTHVRNLVGNALFVPAVNMKNALGAGIESAMRTKERTKAFRTTVESRQFAAQDAKEMQDILQGNADKSVRQLIMDERKTFTIPALNKFSKLNGDALETEDWVFLRYHYQNALAQYITANKLDPNNLDGKDLAKARQYAVKEAQKATYRDANKFSTWLNQASGAGVAVKYMVEGMLPFKKTPTNILRRGVEYSPAMLVERFSKGIIDLNRGKISVNEWIDGVASGLTGTAVFGLGMFLASTGAILGGYADDDDKKKRKLRGEQEYAVKIGNKTYTIDWAAPGSLPLFVGVETMYALKEDGLSLGDLTVSSMRLLDPMINMSMLQGLNDTLDAISYAQGTEKISALIAETMYSLLGQFVPTLFGQVARTIDTTQRINYQDVNKGMSKNMLYFFEKMQNKIPYMTFSNDPYLNEFGQENVTEHRMIAALQNFVSPGYISEIKDDEVLDELDRLSEAQEENVYPKKMDKYLGKGDDRIDLTSAQYTQFQRTAGQLSYNILDNMIDDSRYNNLTADQQAEAIKMAYDYAKAVGRLELQPEYELKGDAKKVYEAVEEGSQAYDAILTLSQTKAVTGDIVGDKDEKGKTITGTEKLNKIKAILDSKGSVSEKAAMFESLYPDDNLYKEWKKSRYSAVDYMKYYSDIKAFSGDKKQEQVVSYIKRQTSDVNKQKLLFQVAGYELDSTKDGKTIPDGNFKKKMGY